MKTARFLSFLLVALLATLPAAADTWVVTRKGAGAIDRLSRDLHRLGAGVVAELPQIGVVIVEVDDAESFAASAEGLRGVLAAAPDSVFHLDPGTAGLEDLVPAGAAIGGTPIADPSGVGSDETYFGLQWTLDAVDAPEAWARDARGAGVRVAVLDSGIDGDHPDLAPNLDRAASASFIPGESWDAFPGFAFHHGTQVAGLIAAADNGLGIVGVAPEAELIAVKVISERTGGGSLAALLQGIVHAADAGADVINLSLGSGVRLRDGEPAAKIWVALSRAASYAHQSGATLVASAGNDAHDLDADADLRIVPAQLPHVLAVSATAPAGWALDPSTDLDLPTDYTNFGRSGIHFAAPGGGFFDDPGAFGRCTVAGVTSLCFAFDFAWTTISEGWRWAVGTSFAAPHVAGVAALVIGEAGGDLHPARVESALRRGADDLGEPGQDPYFGHGRINAAGALGR